MENFKSKLNYKHTMSACFIGYIIQAIACNFAPLLFVSWSKELNISIAQTTTIITLTFFVQMAVDFLSSKFVDKIGYKSGVILAHTFAAAGFISLSVLPFIMNSAYLGIIISVILYATGSGLLEVLISPIVEFCPTDNKAAAMSLLHSFYCWGSVFVVAVSSAFFVFCGRDNWRYLALLWALISILNGLFISLVPIPEPHEDAKKTKLSDLLKNKLFVISVIIMICSGASEIAMSQWASTFAETGLNVSKTVGDLMGPMAFAVLMGIGRIIFSKLSSRIKIEKYLILSAAMCIISYILASFSPNAVLSLVGCALCGLSVSAMWPATISLTSQNIASGTTAMFALLALSGDMGCTAGPTAIGWITNLFAGDLKKGLAFAIIFPVIIIISICVLEKIQKKKL